MKGRKTLLLTIIISILAVSSLFADRTSVLITAPDKVKQGEDIIISLKVTHSGNNLFHYTNWVKLIINGKEHQKWEFSAFNKPEDEIFTREVTVKATEKMDIEAEGNCNLHGSTGVAKHTIHVN